MLTLGALQTYQPVAHQHICTGVRVGQKTCSSNTGMIEHGREDGLICERSEACGGVGDSDITDVSCPDRPHDISLV